MRFTDNLMWLEGYFYSKGPGVPLKTGWVEVTSGWLEKKRDCRRWSIGAVRNMARNIWTK